MDRRKEAPLPWRERIITTLIPAFPHQGGRGGCRASGDRLPSPGSRAWGALLILIIFFTLIPVVAAAQTVDLVMVVDESGSLCTKSPPGNVAVEVEGLVTALNEVVVPSVNRGAHVRVAVVSFGTKVTVRIGLTDMEAAKDEVIAALRAITRSPDCGETNLGTAVNRAKAILDGGTAPLRIINLVTDGAPTLPLTTAGPESFFQSACTAARAAGYEIWAVGIGEAKESSLVQCAASSARYFYASTVAGFVSVEEQKLRTILKPAVSADPDLWITKTASAETVKAGEELVWTLAVGNAGPQNEYDALVSDPLPSGVTLVSISPSQGRCESNNNIIDCHLGRIPSGGRATITIRARVDSDFAGTLSNTASVLGQNEDPNKGNNRATATTRVSGSRNPGGSSGEDPPLERPGITVDYKAELLGAAADLNDELHELLAGLTAVGEGEIGIFPLIVLIKDLKVGCLAALESTLEFADDYGDLAAAAMGSGAIIALSSLVELATLNMMIDGLHDSLADVQESVGDLIMDIEGASLEGRIGQPTADSLTKKTIRDEQGNERPYAPLLVIMVLLAEKNQALVEIDKLFEQAIEFQSEAVAWLAQVVDTCNLGADPEACARKAIKEAMAALEKSIKLIREAEKLLWGITDNIKTIKAWLCGFQQLVIRAPLLTPEEEQRIICPWCLPPLSGAAVAELRTYYEPGAIRFAALGGAVQGMRVRVFNLSGRAVFDSGMVAGNMLIWRTSTLANGVYLYAVELATPAGVIRTEVRKIVILR
ncbi:MAG: VWA domain-containing protein [Candidatus Acetothermia bacterium]|jgi:uncharacterized repeat protein (TIGR01451 family)|nr:VWA domain-containing protein [Candidatus Acetothermia bacterium]MDH7505589.1 VWA domain-containing protein [Candidatus Acetothermia bacterium]